MSRRSPVEAGETSTLLAVVVYWVPTTEIVPEAIWTIIEAGAEAVTPQPVTTPVSFDEEVIASKSVLSTIACAGYAVGFW
jgi:hypothetical protein